MLNNEIEAKVGWIIYINAKNNQDHRAITPSTLGFGYIAFDCLSDAVAWGVYESSQYAQWYINAKNSLVSVGDTYKKYTFLEDVDALDFELLNSILINCR